MLDSQKVLFNFDSLKTVITFTDSNLRRIDLMSTDFIKNMLLVYNSLLVGRRGPRRLAMGWTTPTPWGETWCRQWGWRRICRRHGPTSGPASACFSRNLSLHADEKIFYLIRCFYYIRYCFMEYVEIQINR